jgi:hypothetical protein
VSQPPLSQKHGTLRLIAAANFIIAALFLIFSLPFFWRQAQVLRSWAETDAQVLRSEVLAGPPEGHEIVYRAQLRLLYTVGGNPVTSDLVSFSSKNYDATLRRTNQFPVGSHHPVRYDPANPSQARLGAAWTTTFFAVPLLVLGMAVLFGFIGTVFLTVAKAAS